MTVFYKNYLSLCAKANKTPSAVATAIGLSNAAASGWKKGKEPTDATLQKLADYFGVAVEALTEEQNNKPATLEGSELTDAQREVLDYIKDKDEEDLKAFLAAFKAYNEAKGK